MRRFWAGLIVAIVAVACTEQLTAPKAATRAPARTMKADFMNNPDVTNGVIMRSGEEFAICWTDPTNHLRVCHRTEQFPGGDCGVFDPIGGIDNQAVVTLTDPNDFFAAQVHINQMGRLWVTVRDLSQPGTCYGAKRIGEGWGNIHYTDNDLFGTDPSQPSTNTSGFSARATLTASDGSTIGYNGRARFVFHPDKPTTVFDLMVNVH